MAKVLTLEGLSEFYSQLQSSGLASSGGVDLLWENASPTSTFEPQTTSLNGSLSNYNALLIYICTSRSDYPNWRTPTLVYLPYDSTKEYVAISMRGTNEGTRRFTLTDTSVVWAGGYGNTSSASTSLGVPTHVYGIRW